MQLCFILTVVGTAPCAPGELLSPWIRYLLPPESF